MALKLLCFFSIALCKYGVDSSMHFPDGFLFGAASSSYQTEGGWNLDGRGESIWDRLVHTSPEMVAEGANGDDATDSYRQYARDVKMLAELGVDFYRLSLSWPRIMPDGTRDSLNRKGLDFYHALLDELIGDGVAPMVTLYHWDLPQALEDDGGFLNETFPAAFEDYAKVAFEEFGDKVRYWVTFNEPDEICVQGYGMNIRAPSKNLHGHGEYKCAANLLTAHARAYHLYDRHYRDKQKGLIGFAVGAQWAQAEYEDVEEERIAADDALQFHVGYFTNPIFSPKGGYPRQIIDRVPSERLGKLPDFDLIKNTSDFLGLNHYDVYYASRNTTSKPKWEVPSFDDDLGVVPKYIRRWSEEWLRVGPPGFGKLLSWAKINCNDPPIIITEFGVASGPGLDDRQRVWFIRRYLLEALKAIAEVGVKLRGVAVWSLMDNFEWLRGYAERYGLYQVDFDDVNKTRVPRRSAYAYKEIIRSRTVDPWYMNEVKWERGPAMESLTVYKFTPEFHTKPTSINKRRANQTDIDYAIETMDSQLRTFNTPFEVDYP